VYRINEDERIVSRVIMLQVVERTTKTKGETDMPAILDSETPCPKEKLNAKSHQIHCALVADRAPRTLLESARSLFPCSSTVYNFRELALLEDELADTEASVVVVAVLVAVEVDVFLK
jgi:hypothetical protein